jgi:xanthine dehydrogenase accessory factor
LVLGCGDVGSTVAVRLHESGMRVVMRDEPRPAWHRRGMALVDAMYEGQATLDGVLARKIQVCPASGQSALLANWIAVVDAAMRDTLRRWRPGLVVDARMRKYEEPERIRGEAAVVIGLGPGFEAGTHVDVVIETAWGHKLGEPVWSGRALPATREPRKLNGHGRKRYVYSPAAGCWSTSREIGEFVAEGELIGEVDGQQLLAPLSGILRGISADGAEVRQRTKIAEVDTSCDIARAFGVGRRPERIAQGVLLALAEFTYPPALRRTA